MSAREGMSVDEALAVADSWGAVHDAWPRDGREAFRSLAAEVRSLREQNSRLRSPAPVFDMEAAVKCARSEVELMTMMWGSDRSEWSRAGRALDSLVKALPHLQSDMEALRRDKERMDIVESMNLKLDPHGLMYGQMKWRVFRAGTDELLGTGETPRQAIDAALAAQAGKQGGG